MVRVTLAVWSSLHEATKFSLLLQHTELTSSVCPVSVAMALLPDDDTEQMYMRQSDEHVAKVSSLHQSTSSTGAECRVKTLIAWERLGLG